MSGGPATVRAGVDTWVSPEFPNANYRRTVNIRAGGSHSGHQAYAYLYLHNPAPRRATIVHATLRIWGRGDWGPAARNVHVGRLTTPFKVGQVTWNTRPGHGLSNDGVVGEVLVSQPNHPSHTLWEFNVTTMIQNVTNGQPWHGFRIRCEDTGVMQPFFSLNASSHRPTLEVEWSDAPQRPTDLHPSGGQIVSIARPTLGFTYIDIGRGSGLRAVHVQIAGDATHAPIWTGTGNNVHWDSGVVLTDEPELDLERADVPGGQYAGLSDGMTRWWRVRVQDMAQHWSDWSARADGVGAKMTRHNKSALTMSNPQTPPNNWVADVTPPISWHFAGTQKHWQMMITRPTNPTVNIWNSGRRSSEVTTHDIPRGVLTEFHGMYQVRLRVWDQYDRATTPGDPPFQFLVRDFQLRGAAARVPPQNLRGEYDPDGKPYLYLFWTMPSQPDAFHLWRDGRTIRQHVDSNNLMMAGNPPGRYRFVDKDATPNITHTWTVSAVYNQEREQSDQAPHWTGMIRSDHAWLIDWPSDRIVAILDPDISFETPDTSVTFEPIMRNRVVRVNSVRRGMQGTVSGRITGFGNMTTRDWRDNFLWMAARPGRRQYRLMVGNRSWRVLLGDMTVAPMRIPNSEAEAVSFSFWSLDGPEQPR